ncbi:MAG: hypothetical protein E2O73_03805, partial [Deltaproteobacteria bacterium]
YSRPGQAPLTDPLRIALAVEGTRGDVHPMLALGTSLLARGHEVLVLGGAGARARCRRA